MIEIVIPKPLGEFSMSLNTTFVETFVYSWLYDHFGESGERWTLGHKFIETAWPTPKSFQSIPVIRFASDDDAVMFKLYFSEHFA